MVAKLQLQNGKVTLSGGRRNCNPQPATFFDCPLACVCAYAYLIYKIKIKKIIYYIELRYTRPLRVGKTRPQNRKRNRVAGCVVIGLSYFAVLQFL